jgi:hypothetical protein
MAKSLAIEVLPDGVGYFVSSMLTSILLLDSTVPGTVIASMMLSVRMLAQRCKLGKSSFGTVVQ